MAVALPTLVLASTSTYRRELMDRLGVPYLATPHLIDERAAEPPGAGPDAIARTLARLKADSLAALHPGAHILGSDQVVDVDGRTLGKPGTPEAACAQLAALAGRAHRLVTAVCLRSPDGQHQEALDVHVMHVRALDAGEIARYVARDAPLDCAGSYRIEAGGIALLERIEGADFTAIIGMPLITVAAMLRRCGFAAP
jgi:septum formation protein